MRVLPPDMERRDDHDVRRPCYSLSELARALDPEVVEAIADLHDGTPIWPETVRAFLVGYYSVPS